jgi:hypothetical protein
LKKDPEEEFFRLTTLAVKTIHHAKEKNYVSSQLSLTAVDLSEEAVYDGKGRRCAFPPVPGVDRGAVDREATRSNWAREVDG